MEGFNGPGLEVERGTLPAFLRPARRHMSHLPAAEAGERVSVTERKRKWGVNSRELQIIISTR